MRAGLTRVCERCRLRVPDVAGACPACASGALIEGPDWLARSRARRQKIEEDQKRREAWRERIRARIVWVVHLAGSATLSATFIVYNVITNPEGWDRPLLALIKLFFLLWFCVALCLLPVGVGLGFLVARIWLSRSGARERIKPEGLGLWRRETQPVSGEVILGQVRARQEESLRSPLGDRACVAFRLKGMVGSSEVDDDGAVPFDVETDGGERVHVEPPAAVFIEGGRAASIRRVSGPLKEFLTARGLEHEGADIKLAEALLVEGDQVEVRGVISRELDPAARAGFRQAPVALVVRGQAEAPLLLRKRDHE